VGAKEIQSLRDCSWGKIFKASHADHEP
jgi:hypothetical protein